MVTLDRLEAYTVYNISVSAHSDSIQGPYSAPILVQTKEDGEFSRDVLACSQKVLIDELIEHLYSAHIHSIECLWRLADVLACSQKVLID
jgi:hypothetical protein